MDSQAIVNTMEVLETKPINELVTEATIKVCYVSETANPNDTVINKEVGRQIAATLPGAPVVGFFDESSGDFVEHSRKITIKDGNLVFEDLTKPYGFVSFEAPWYQDFMENGIVRTYLMCKAYLWTRQYKEASLALNKGQSMELDEKSMSGYYEGDVFVFTEAVLDKLCILGDAYAPCFEGAKIMSTYAKQYESLAEQVENILGRRYYVMNGQLAPKPEKYTYEYAVQLGWNLTDAVYAQLAQRGASEKYHIEGIFTEPGGVIFVILQDNATLEYVRVSLEITGEETVELGTEMTAVTQSWTPKAPAEPQSVEPLGGNTVQASTDPAASTTPAEPAPAPTPAPAPATVASAYTAEPAAEPAEPSAEPSAEPTAEPVADPVAEPVAEPTAEPVSGNFSAEPAAEPTTDPVAEPAAEPVADPAPAIDYALEHEKLTARVTELEGEIASKDTRISELEAELNTYHQKDVEAENQKKNDMIASYSAMLSEEEIQPIMEKLNELTVDEVEAKLAVTYTRKQRAEQHTSAGIQVNVQANPAPVDTLPEFMRQALELEASSKLNLSI